MGKCVVVRIKDWLYKVGVIASVNTTIMEAQLLTISEGAINRKEETRLNM